MPDVRRVFLTGATGFLGSHLARALLDAGHSVKALVRTTSSRSPRERLLEVLSRVSPAPLDPAKLEVVAGDLSESEFGLDAAVFDDLPRDIDEIWHCAASLSFLEEDRAEIFRMNVGGTRSALELARKIPGRRLHHISTAYVAGDRRGVVLEDDLAAGQGFRNPYEESKFEAEVLVRTASESDQIDATVYRPSIVIGDSVSGRATHFHGVYAFIRGLWTVSRRLRRGSSGSGYVELPLRILGSETSTLNFVPIDFVTDAIMTLSARTWGGCRTFHLTNPNATPNTLWIGIICRQLGIRGVQLADEESFRKHPMTRLETMFHRQMTFFAPYLASEPKFDCTHTLEGLRTSQVRCPEVTPEFAARMTGWYIDLLNGTTES